MLIGFDFARNFFLRQYGTIDTESLEVLDHYMVKAPFKKIPKRPFNMILGVFYHQCTHCDGV